MVTTEATRPHTASSSFCLVAPAPEALLCRGASSGVDGLVRLSVPRQKVRPVAISRRSISPEPGVPDSCGVTRCDPPYG